MNKMLIIFFSFFFSSLVWANQTKEVALIIKPSDTNSAITVANTPHLVLYHPTEKNNKILLWLPGTKGLANPGPKDFFKTALEVGYRVVSLSYIDVPAVDQMCRNKNLENDPQCAFHFRIKRIYGVNATNLIKDLPQDAIVSRFTKLLQYLVQHYPSDGWQVYLKDGKPNWSLIVVAGQSQGGGMSEFIAKREKVAKIISFSGGWDKGLKGIADWYYDKSVSPPHLWYGTYNAAEPEANVLAETYKALNIPSEHIYKLSLPVSPGKKAHPDGVHNVGYKSIWLKMLEAGN